MRNRLSVLVAVVMALAFSAFAQEWAIPISAYTHPDTVRTVLAHTSIHGSDLYDSSVVIGTDTIVVDRAAPPPPMGGLYVTFPLDDPSYPYIPRLLTDGRSAYDDTIIWTINWSGADFTDNVVVSWDPSLLPPDGNFQIDTAFIGTLVDWDSAQNMRTVSSITGNGMMNYVQMRFVRTVPDVDTIPPHFTNWHPPDGATDVPETTSYFSVDAIDASPIDESSITLNVAGFDVPSMFLTITDIPGGKRISASTMGMITLPLDSTITCRVCAADIHGNDACGTSSFRTRDTVVTTYCVEGHVTLGGETDHSGSIVIIGAYHDTTDASGYYEVCAPEGDYTMYVLAWDGRADSLDIVLDVDQVHDFHFPASGGSIAGTVILDGEIDHSGTVVTELASGVTTSTDASGSYFLGGVEFGTVRVQASHSGFEAKVDTFAFSADTTGVDFILFPITSSYSVTGTITLEGMTIHSGTNVHLSDGMGFDQNRTTNGAGYFSFPDVPEGGYTLTASKAGYETWDTTLLVSDDVVISRMLAEEASVYLNPPSNVQGTTRPIWPGAFNLVTWDPPMQADTVKLAHCSARGYGDTRWGGFSIYYGYGWAGGGYAMPFVAPRDGMTLSRLRFAMHPFSYGNNSRIHVWAQDPSTGGPGAVIWSSTVAMTDTSRGWAYVNIPGGVTVGTDVFFVGWHDPTDTDVLYVMYDYTSPDTLAWVHNAGDSSWSWEGDNVDMADGDFAIECYVSGGARLADGDFIRPGMDREKLRTAQRSNPEAARALAEMNFRPKSLEGPNIDIHSVTSAPAPRTRPAESPTQYKLYRHTAPFTDVSVAELVTTLPDTAPYYLDMDDIHDVTYYYGMTAVYPSGESGLSVLGKGYNRNPPAGTNVLLIDWCGGPQLDALGWDWDASDTMATLLRSAGFTGDSLMITGEQERLYGYFFVDDDDNPMFDIIVISWSPLSAWGWLGPRMRGPEWRKLDDYLRNGGKLFIEGADAMQILSGHGYASNQYDSLYSHFGVSFSDPGIASLDTGNVRELTGAPPLFALSDTVEYSLGTISDFGIDEFEHSMASGATTVLWSQIFSPMPHATNGRGVWRSTATSKTYVQSVYLGGMIDIPLGGSKAGFLQKILDGFGVNPTISEKGQSLPGEMTLYPNFPNPFNAATDIYFEVSRAGDYDLSVYDLMGKRVANLVSGTLISGAHKTSWNGRDFSGAEVESGVYFYRLKGDAGDITKRMILLK